MKMNLTILVILLLSLYSLSAQQSQINDIKNQSLSLLAFSNQDTTKSCIISKDSCTKLNHDSCSGHNNSNKKNQGKGKGKYRTKDEFIDNDGDGINDNRCKGMGLGCQKRSGNCIKKK